jgi:uncharacterized Fe-S cluster-containing radical SAM superfamily protein
MLDKKSYIKNTSFCPLPWTGFYLEPDGKVKNCVVAGSKLGDLKKQTIPDIMADVYNLQIQADMLADNRPASCRACYDLEAGKKSLDIVSSRLYYLKEMKNLPVETYGKNKFDLRHCDVRWQNTCNFACVYCSPEYSSKWESELQIHIDKPDSHQMDKVKQYIFSHVRDLNNVYLAGGEPLLMTQNEQLLDLLLTHNPHVHLRINTNLSKVKTNVFDMVCKFQNVHWTISVESMDQEYEYIRYGGKWSEFLENLSQIKRLGHKISFNMLWLLLNPYSIFECIDYLKELGFGANSFVLGPITFPRELDVRNLPEKHLDALSDLIKFKINQKPGFLLQDGYSILLDHLQRPFQADPQKSKDFLNILDTRRRLSYEKTFPHVHNLMQGNV